MNEKKEIILFSCAITNGIANVVAIISYIIGIINIAILVLGISLMLILSGLIFIIIKYIDKCDFINFIKYLIKNNIHDFNLLPKICLLIDKNKKYNKFNVKEMTINYIYDMSEIDTTELTKNKNITYNNTIEYIINAENKNLPKNFVFHRGNMSATSNPIIKQKHGSQTEYRTVPRPADNCANSWALIDNNISKSNLFSICFLLKNKEKSRANAKSNLIFYPKQFAKHIDFVNFNIKLIHK